ncbi:MAG: hypothetical protein H6Q13_1203 [Bacteroidetes bacterium]|nr:hypothetical protein [Bacteroidota bacterium]
MKKIETLIVLFTLLLASSCGNEMNDAAPVDSSSGVEVSLSLKSASAGLLSSGTAVQSRSTDPSSVNDAVLHNAWVLQFIDGNFEKKIYKDSGLDKAFGVKLTYNDSGVQSHIYVVANMGEDAFTTDPSSEAAFKAGMLNITTEAGLQLTSGSLPMMGDLELEVTESVISQTVELERMVARVTLKYTITASLATELILTSARVCNVPDEFYFTAPTDDSVFPTTPTLHDGEVTDLTLSGTPDSDSLVYYLPDNRRGTGSNAGGDATGKSGVEDATYIELIGFYKGDRVEYHLYPGADDVNDYNIVRNTDYTMNITLTGLSTDDKRVVSRTATSNSYIVGTATESLVYIPVKRANQTTEFGEQLPDLGSGWSSSVIWRDNSSLEIETDDSDKAYGIFKVKVNSSGQSGNAVVCIKDASNNILWSWQIWVTSYDPDSENETYNSYTFMDRNLGAVNDTQSDAGALGLFYQWGRKDPFVGASTTSGTTLKTLYAGGSGSTTYASTNTTAPTTSANNLSTAIRNPGVFYYRASTPYDWYAGSSIAQNDVLWGTIKTVYDPCPEGWKVPPIEAFSSWDSSTSNSNWGGNGRIYMPVPGSWYPASGYRSSSTGALGTVGASGFCWSSVISAANASCLIFNSSGVNSTSGNRAYGFGVRCVQEN